MHRHQISKSIYKMTPQMYDVQAGSIKIEDIATNDNNRIVLNRMKRNRADDTDILYIQNRHDENGKGCIDYVPEGAHDMGWVGYFVSKSSHLEKLYITLRKYLNHF